MADVGDSILADVAAIKVGWRNITLGEVRNGAYAFILVWENGSLDGATNVTDKPAPSRIRQTLVLSPSIRTH